MSQITANRVHIVGCSPENAMRIVRELREAGLQQGQDFNFSYHPVVYDTFGYEPAHTNFAEFIFYQERYATMFSLKYL